MITWAERAKAATAHNGQSRTDRTEGTDENKKGHVSRLPLVLSVPYPTILEKHRSSTAATLELDRWCWPHSTAMNGAEIALLTWRLNWFSSQGLPRDAAETLADKLALRDREQDD